MIFYAPQILGAFEKLKKLIDQRNGSKKQRLYKGIQKATLNFDLTEQYTPITKRQKHRQKLSITPRRTNKKIRRVHITCTKITHVRRKCSK